MDAVSLSSGPTTTPVAANSGNAKAAGATVQVRTDPTASVSSSEDTYWSPKHFAQNVDQFKNLTSTILDTSGKYSEDDRVKAYSSLFEMAVKGKLSGIEGDNEKIYEKALIESDIAQRAARIVEQAVASSISANARGDSVAGDKLQFIANLSEADQKLHYSISENGFDMAGNRQFASFDSYRDQLVANAVHDAPEPLRVSMKGVGSAKSGDAWNTHILSLFSSNGPSTWGVNKAKSEAGSTSNPKLPLSYQPGNLFTRVA